MWYERIGNDMLPGIEKFVSTFLKKEGLLSKTTEFQPLAGDGSSRLFWRIVPDCSSRSFIIMANFPQDEAAGRENFAYVMIGRHLHSRGAPLPEIYRWDLDRGLVIMEDMGSSNLQDVVLSREDPIPIYRTVLHHLFGLQISGQEDFDPSWCCQTEVYDHVVMIRYEAEYFRDAFLHGYVGLKREWPELQAPFTHLAKTASKAENRFFLHRDFQSRNIMVGEDRIGILDWQGGRLGPLGYDLASLMNDPYTALSPKNKRVIYHHYLGLLKDYDISLIDPFESYFPYLAIQRNLQVLGAFGFLTKVRGKKHFEAYIPTALRSLSLLLDNLQDPKLKPLQGALETVQSKMETAARSCAP
jgi:aminoglycoside/choline kinase family phosphotransferase